MRGAGLLLVLLLAGTGLPGCHRTVAPPATPLTAPTVPAHPIRVLVIEETEGPGGAAVAESARSLGVLVEHFEEGCAFVMASQYEGVSLAEYEWVFYFAGKREIAARAAFTADLEEYGGTVVWVGPEVQTLGNARVAELGLRPGGASGSASGPVEWTVRYRERPRVERLAVPEMQMGEGVAAAVTAQRGEERRPFLVGGGNLWYAACGPVLARERFWTTCVWADMLHEIMGQPHEDRGRRMVAVLREVPVWATERQVPAVIEPMLEAGVPVGVLAWTQMGEVPLADRPEAVRGLRAAESLGAVVVLSADTMVDAREQFRLAWEVRLHPVAWYGPVEEANPFRLRLSDPDGSPPYSAGGVLPAPIAISDAGYISPEEAERLRMLEVVRDGVAVVSFGLWAPASPFLEFLRSREAEGWQVSDLRDFGVLVTDTRRVLASGETTVRFPSESPVQKTVLGPTWGVEGEETLSAASSSGNEQTVSAPARSVVVLEPFRERPSQPLIKGVTLDPWAYDRSRVSADALAEALAERYRRNGVNTVFFYVYNVNEGAAYRTRYRGASMTDWGRQDLLAHVLEACHARDIRVVAWLYSGRDRGMWQQHPDWRERTRDGREHNPLRLHASYFLCPQHPGVRRWYAGLLRDLARRYPTLDGIELCEPVVNWFGTQACYCEVCREEFAAAHPGERLGGEVWRQFRAESLTTFLSTCMEVIAEEGIDSYIMTISDAWSNGAILSPRRQAEESGFDLEALLDGPYPPDWINFEVIWQQWADIYGPGTFNYDWAEETAQRLVRRTDGRAGVVMHVELTDFGSQRMTPEKMAVTIGRVMEAEPDGVECYDSGTIDRKAAWDVLRRAYEELP